MSVGRVARCRTEYSGLRESTLGTCFVEGSTYLIMSLLNRFFFLIWKETDKEAEMSALGGGVRV